MGKEVKIQNIYPLTPMQQGMLFHHLYNKDSRAYFQQLCFFLEAVLDIKVFEESVNKVIEHYDVFRTIFIFEKMEEPKQVVLRERRTKLYYEDISAMEYRERSGYLEVFKEKDIEKGFDITKDILLRFSIFKTGEKEYQVIWSHHHMIMDGWCLGVVLQDFINIYKGLKYKEEQKKDKVYPYVNYINWLVKQDKNAGEEYWKKYLEDYDNEISLPQKREAKSYDYAKKEVHFTIEKELTVKLTKLCRKNNVTLNNAFQAIYAILLQRYNNTSDAVFGAVVSGRNAPVDGIETMVGLFINTIPIRVKLDENQSFIQVLEQVRDNYNQSMKYDYMSLAQIQNTCHLKQNLINTLFIFENYPAREGMNTSSNYKIREVTSFEQTNYDFNLVILPGDKIHIKLKYNALVFEESTVLGIQNHIMEIIKRVCNNPQAAIKDIKMLTDKEYSQLVYEVNDKKMDYPLYTSLHELFEEQAAKTPNSIAAVYKDDTITYLKLNERANSAARGLRNMEVKKNEIVALIMDRSIEMLIGILSVLKANGAYLPIDPKYPPERINYMLSDSKVRVILTNLDKDIWHQEDLSYLKSISIDTSSPVKVVDLRDKALYEQDRSNLKIRSSSGDLAYVIYTSGTTGNPKGVMITNRSVVNLSFNLYNEIYANYNMKLNVALLSPYVFDASIKQIFPCLLFGQTLVIVPEEERLNADKLVEYYKEKDIHISDGTPAHLSIILDSLKEKNFKLPIREFIVGGEALSLSLVRRFFSLYDKEDLKITNVYGPTECCDVSTLYQVDNTNLDKLNTIPIGKTLGNVQIYILDKYLNPVPYNTPGEIYIAGDGLSQGYLNQPELNKGHFIPNPFINGVKMYKTGDLGRRLSSGEIEYLGRADEQVKIRGFRIELEEIKKQIVSFAGIKEAAVIWGVKRRKDEEGDREESKYVAAFVIGESSIASASKKKDNMSINASSINIEALRAHLSKHLPSYMIPAYLMEIDKIPVTHNGKLDKGKLMERINGEEKTEYAAPRNKLEETVTKVWEEILHVKKVGIHDDFFYLGGDDNSALRMTMELQKQGIKLQVSDVRLYPTVAKLDGRIRYAESKSLPPVTGEVELTPIQKDFFGRKLNNKARWNQAFSLFRKEGFEEEIVRTVFKELVKHHDALRMRYFIRNGGIIQYNDELKEEAFTFHTFDLRTFSNPYEKMEEEANHLQGEVRLDKGPLVIVGLFKTEKGDYLLIIIHHLVVDGVSWRIILEDFQTGYRQMLNKENISFPKKTDSFRYWAEQLKIYAGSERVLKELEYWKGIRDESLCTLPTDTRVLNRRFKDIRVKKMEISEEETSGILRGVHRAYGTQTNEILLAILGLAFKDWRGLWSVLINLEGHGREEIIENVNIKRTVGWFTSFYPLLLDMKDTKSLESYIKAVKDNLRSVPDKGIGYGILTLMSKKEEGTILKITSGLPLLKPEINFNYLGQFDEEIKTDIFTLSDGPIGNCMDLEDESQYALNITGKVIDNRLILSFRYNDLEFREDNIEKLTEIFYEKLKEVMAHCLKAAGKIGGKEDTYVPPRNDMEKELAKIWEVVLGTSPIGIHDDFFELGGDSIKAIKILTKANNLSIPVSVKAILEDRTIERIMDNCYKDKEGDKDKEEDKEEEIAVALQSDACDSKEGRTYNKNFEPDTEYPNYYGCMTGVILEKLKHERNIHLERSFLAVGGGKFLLTYGHVNDMGIKNKLQYRELPTEMVPGMVNIFDKLGVKEEVKSFQDLEAGLNYCKEHLERSELIMISGTTYYLNYTPDYCIGENEWKRRLDIRPENIIAVSDKSSGRAHTFLLVDMIKEGYLVYDTTFKYYGIIGKEDFHKSFAGLRGMRFLDGMYAQTTNLPYGVTELDFGTLKEIDNEELALEILKNNIAINLSNQQTNFKANGREFTFYIGVRAYREVAGILREYLQDKSYREELIKLIQASFGSWKYKFMFFLEFLEELSKYREVPKVYTYYCRGFIEECNKVSTQAEGMDREDTENFIAGICLKIEQIYEQQVSFFNNLKEEILI